MYTTLKKQKGASFFSVLLILLMVGFLLSIAFKLYSPYLDYGTVDTVLTQVASSKEEMKKSTTSLEMDIVKKLRINQVKLPNKAITVKRENGVTILNLEYEIRVPMFYNIDAVVSFSKQYQGVGS